MKKLGILAAAMTAPLLVSEAYATCGFMPSVERQQRWSGNTPTIAAGVSLGTLTGGDVEDEPTSVSGYVTYQGTLPDDFAYQLNGIGGVTDTDDLDFRSRGASVQIGHKNLEDGMHVIDIGGIRTRIDDGFGHEDLDARWFGYQGRCFSDNWTIGHSLGVGEFEWNSNEADIWYYEGSANYYITEDARVNAMFDVANISEQSDEIDLFRFAFGFETIHPFYQGEGFGQSATSNVIVGVYAGYNTIDYSNAGQDDVEFFDVSAKIKIIHMPSGTGSPPTLQEYDFFGNLGYGRPRALTFSW